MSKSLKTSLFLSRAEEPSACGGPGTLRKAWCPTDKRARMPCTHPPTVLDNQFRGRMGQRVRKPKVLTTCTLLSDKHHDFIIIRKHLSEIHISNFQ